MAEQETIVANNTEAIADLQAKQLFTGVDSNNEKIELYGNPGGEYSAYTKDEKVKKGQVIDRITWRDTGALYKSLVAKVSNGQFTIISNGETEKYQSMILRSGENVIGLNESERIDFAENILLPNFSKVLLSKTGLNL